MFQILRNHEKPRTNTANSQLGSFIEIPKSLQGEVKALEEQFTVSGQKLKQITDHFVSELDKGNFSW